MKTKPHNSIICVVIYCSFVFHRCITADMNFLQQYEGLNTNCHRFEAPHTAMFNILNTDRAV